MTDDPNFYAWLDGELPDPQASAMAARVAADPELAAFAGQHRALSNRLSAAFAPVLAAPVPDRLQTAAEPRTAEVIDFAARARRRQWSVVGLAAAASLALGLLIGTNVPREGGPFRSTGGQLAAAGSLDAALDRQLAAAGEQNGVRIGLSFKDREGRYCRTFAAEAQNGLACRRGENWAIEGLVRSGFTQGDYRMASGQDPALSALIDSRIAGEAFDPAAEAQAVTKQWED
ncbi:anti-sigma factor [Sphingomonas kaistensis]|uniref:Anti-sigma factor n=1 Tax=Sphingomonas kaistensis TaxID=298708 RepID=A0ABZ2FY60_9SPHN